MVHVQVELLYLSVDPYLRGRMINQKVRQCASGVTHHRLIKHEQQQGDTKIDPACLQCMASCCISKCTAPAHALTETTQCVFAQHNRVYDRHV